MSALGDLLYTRLTTDGTVSAQVSTRVYPDHLPQSPTLPAIAYQIISSPANLDSNTNLLEVRFQFDCYTSTYDLANSLAKLVRQSLRYLRRTDGSNTILSIHEVNQQDAYEDNPEVWRAIVDVIAIVHEA